MNTQFSTPLTLAFKSDTFADGFREARICIPFQDLKLQGPEGSFQASGILVSRDNIIRLEYSPLPVDGSSLPNQTGNKKKIAAKDFWKAEGTTFHGLKLRMTGLVPPFFNQTTTNGHVCFSPKIEMIFIEREDHITDEILTLIQGEKKAKETKLRQKTNPSVVMQASLAKTTLRYHNASTIREIKNPFFSSKEEKLDTLVSVIEGWEYSFHQDSNDVVIRVCSTDTCMSPDILHDRQVLDGILASFSFMNGCEAIPWRVQHQRNGSHSADEYRAQFSPVGGASRPFDGPSSLTTQSNCFPARMTSIMADYFRGQSPLVHLMKKHLWQMQQATNGSEMKLYGCLHLCAILEGLAKDLLSLRFNWSKTKLNKTTSMGKLQAVSDAMKLPWKGHFEEVAKVWKNMRDDLAHGDFFGSQGAWSKDMFRLQNMVSGGIFALMLVEAGWNEPIDFHDLERTSHLYYC